jgi:hypothetical protein
MGLTSRRPVGRLPPKLLLAVLCPAAARYNKARILEGGSIMTQRDLSRDEVARLGEELYQQKIRDTVEADESNVGKMIIIDVDTGDYEIDDVGLAAARRLQVRRPGGTLCGLRIGFDAAEGFGYLPQRVKR